MTSRSSNGRECVQLHEALGEWRHAIERFRRAIKDVAVRGNSDDVALARVSVAKTAQRYRTVFEQSLVETGIGQVFRSQREALVDLAVQLNQPGFSDPAGLNLFGVKRGHVWGLTVSAVNAPDQDFDLRPLRMLRGLKTLNLSRLQDAQLEHLASLPQLSRLTITGSRIRRSRTLAHLTHVRTLKLDRVYAKSLTGLQNLGALRELELSGLSPRLRSTLPTLSGLTVLRIADCGRLTNLEFLAEAQSLAELELSNVDLPDLTGLEHLEELFELVLTGDVAAYAGLGGPNLRHIGLKKGRFPPLRELPELPELISLGLNSTSIDTLDGIERFQTTTQVILEYNRVASLDPLLELPELDLVLAHEVPVAQEYAFNEAYEKRYGAGRRPFPVST